MTEREALLRAVCEDPDDDTPRLVFADWLDENGEPERAELIRLQVLMAQVKNPGEMHWRRWHELCAREQELLCGREENWWQELPAASGYRLGRHFTRGFIEVLHVTDWEAFARDAEIVFWSTPVRTGYIKGQVSFAQPETLNYLSRFRSLNFDGLMPSPEDWQALIAAALPHLEHLSLPLPENEELRQNLEARFEGRLPPPAPWGLL